MYTMTNLERKSNEVDTKVNDTQQTDTTLQNDNGYKLKIVPVEGLTNEFSQGQADVVRRYIKQEVKKSELKAQEHLSNLREENRVPY